MFVLIIIMSGPVCLLSYNERYNERSCMLVLISIMSGPV